MGSKHRPAKWWLQGALEEEAAEAQRLNDERWARENTYYVEKYTRPSAKTVDEFSGVRRELQQHPPPLTDQQKIEQDVLLLGVGFGMLQDDGTVKHMPAARMLVYHRDHILHLPTETIKLKVKI